MEATCDLLHVQQPKLAANMFALDVLKGLSGTPKSLPSKYFYDEQGCKLFQQITETEEYYLTRCEAEILQSHSRELRRRLAGSRFRLIELGTGDGHKTEALLDELLRQGLRFPYVPIDICPEVIMELVTTLPQKFAGLPLRVHGLVGEYADALAWLSRHNGVRNLVLFLGSSIGNFDPLDTRLLLGDLSGCLKPGDYVLIGFDLKKDPATMERAYNDAQGITRQFNFNLLERINRELRGDFEPERFRHRGFYNAARGRMESWLVSTAAQEVEIGVLRRKFPFQAGEGIHVENSYKYELRQIEELAHSAGFVVDQHFFDARQYFVDSLWRV